MQSVYRWNIETEKQEVIGLGDIMLEDGEVWSPVTRAGERNGHGG